MVLKITTIRNLGVCYSCQEAWGKQGSGVTIFIWISSRVWNFDVVHRMKISVYGCGFLSAPSAYNLSIILD